MIKQETIIRLRFALDEAINATNCTSFAWNKPFPNNEKKYFQEKPNLILVNNYSSTVTGMALSDLYHGLPDLFDPRANGIALAQYVWLWSLVVGFGM